MEGSAAAATAVAAAMAALGPRAAETMTAMDELAEGECQGAKLKVDRV